VPTYPLAGDATELNMHMEQEQKLVADTRASPRSRWVCEKLIIMPLPP